MPSQVQARKLLLMLQLDHWYQLHIPLHQALPPPCRTAGDAYTAVAAAVGTDFRQWSEAEVRAFLDQRGEDFDDCHDFEALVRQPALDGSTLVLAVTVC